VNPVVWVFGLLAATIYIVVFVWETLLFQRPGVHQGIFFVPTADVPAVRLWAFGVGFYNLFLGVGAVVGLVLWNAGDEAVGRTLVVFTLVCMFLSAIVLLVADRMALGRERGKGLTGVLAAGGPALVALVAAAV
jgi:putative membrane protein